MQKRAFSCLKLPLLFFTITLALYAILEVLILFYYEYWGYLVARWSIQGIIETPFWAGFLMIIFYQNSILCITRKNILGALGFAILLWVTGNIQYNLPQLVESINIYFLHKEHDFIYMPENVLSSGLFLLRIIFVLIVMRLFRQSLDQYRGDFFKSNRYWRGINAVSIWVFYCLLLGIITFLLSVFIELNIFVESAVLWLLIAFVCGGIILIVYLLLIVLVSKVKLDQLYLFTTLKIAFPLLLVPGISIFIVILFILSALDSGSSTQGLLIVLIFDLVISFFITKFIYDFFLKRENEKSKSSTA